MNGNPVRAAIELVDVTPSNEFRSTLRAQLLADFTRSDTDDGLMPRGPNALPLESPDDYIALAPDSSRFDQKRPFSKSLLAAVACVAVIATGAVLIRARQSQNVSNELHDVNQGEALPLAERALITTDALGIQWTSGYAWGESGLPLQAADTIAALPDCELLTAVGLFPPTAKSATAHQFVSGNNYLFHEVLVFATREDASRAMDVIDSAVLPKCWFELYDRLMSITGVGWASTTEAWVPPHVYGPLEPFEIPPHGDRQVLIGQHTTINRSSPPMERYFINAFVQVGRTISWVNPLFVIPNNTSTSESAYRAVGVNEVITAATSALNKALGH
ncbi:MAG TPA: hypothetical protein VHN36_01075 [Ilumatobacteraceae bacterium]|nr:hypothetical protein [Ilumatobacteraceae bacterium]